MAADVLRPTEPTATVPKRVYTLEEGHAGMRNLLGGKGAGLAEMTRAGLPVPPGFTITTRGVPGVLPTKAASCRKVSTGEIERAMRELEERTGKAFGGVEQSAAGLGAQRRARLDARHDGHDPQSRPQRRDGRGPREAAPATERFAWDAYRRFIAMFGSVVLGIEKDLFEDASSSAQSAAGREDRSRARRRDVEARRGASSRRSSARTRGTRVPAGRARAA